MTIKEFIELLEKYDQTKRIMFAHNSNLADICEPLRIEDHIDKEMPLVVVISYNETMQ